MKSCRINEAKKCHKCATKSHHRRGNILLLCPEVCQGYAANWKEPNMRIEQGAAYHHCTNIHLQQLWFLNFLLLGCLCNQNLFWPTLFKCHLDQVPVKLCGGGEIVKLLLSDRIGDETILKLLHLEGGCQSFLEHVHNGLQIVTGHQVIGMPITIKEYWLRHVFVV